VAVEHGLQPPRVASRVGVGVDGQVAAGLGPAARAAQVQEARDGRTWRIVGERRGGRRRRRRRFDGGFLPVARRRQGQQQRQSEGAGESRVWGDSGASFSFVLLLF
jgi:hypothetical protein